MPQKIKNKLLGDMRIDKAILLIAFIACMSILAAFVSHPRIRDIPFKSKSIQKQHYRHNTLSIEFVTAISIGIPGAVFIAVFKRLGTSVDNALQFFVVFLTAHLVVTAIVENTKNIVGRFRPDFIDRCRPLLYVCTGDKRVVTDGRKSFPSGHSATCALGFLYLYVFLRSRIVRSTNVLRFDKKLYNFLVSVIIISVPIVINITRYVDNRHFLTDVIAGDIIGGLIGVVFFVKYGKILLLQDCN